MKPSPQKYVRLRVLKRHGATPMLLLLLACGVLYPVTAAWSSAAAGASDAHALAAARPSHFAAAPGVPAAAIDLNSTPIYGQPYDGRAFEGPSSKISGGQQFDREVVDDFDLNASLTRVVVRGARGGYNMPPNPTYYGVYVRFYDGVQGTPGALQAEHFLPPGAPGVVFDAARPSTFDITLPSPFNATGRHFFSVQPVFGGSETWGVMSGGYPNVRGSAWLKRDRVADGGTWTVGGVAGNLNDMSFDLFGTLLSAPRIDTLSPNPIPRSGLLRISGAYFGAAQGASRLTIDGKQSQYIAHWSDSLIIAYVPEASTLGDVPVSITTDAGTGSATLGVTTRPADGRIRWRFTVAGDYVLHRSGIGADRSIYLNDVNGRLYALSPDGGLKWVFQAGKVGYVGPVTVGADGTVYVAGLVPKNPATPCQLGDNIVAVDGIFAVNPDGTQKWLFDQTCQGIIAGPNVGPDGKIYAVSDAGGIGAFALNPDGALAYAVERFGEHGSLGEEIVFGPPAPGLPPTQQYFQFDNGNLFGYTLQGQRVFSYPTVTTGQPVAGLRTGSVYTVGFPIGAGYRLLSLTPQGALRWQAPIRPTSGLSAPDTPLNEAAVYVVQDAFKLHRVSPSDGSVVWTFTDGEELFAPVASPDDRLVLLGGRVNYGQPGFFEAVSNDGRLLWKQYLPNEPGFSPDGVVMPISRARFAADGQTAYIAADVIGDKPSASNPVYSFFYALDTSNNSVPANQPPRATLTSPSPNANVPVRTGINLTAKVEDDGQIARVDFYYNRNGFQTLFGSDTTPDADGNYGFNFTPTEPGVYGLFAAAYDVGGLRGDSPLVTITVSSHPPTVAWASPAAGSSFAAPASLTLTARAADSDGTVVGVEFKSAQVGVLGSDMTPDAAGLYQIEWANPPQGAHELTASAIDDSGHIRSASITVNVAPASIPTYALGGTVRDSGGAPLSGVNVTLDNSTPATTTTGADGSYFFSGLRGGGNYSVTPSKSGYSFSPAQRVYNDLSANQTADFAATPLTYTLSGRVAHGEIGLAGATITISGDRAGATTTDAQGNYSFGSLPSGGSVLVTPSLANYTFTPPSRSINLDGERSGIDFAAVPVPPMVRFSASAYQFSEAGGRAEITLTRSGDISGAASILFQTLDDAEAVPCATLNGKAYARCDYATTIETLSWPAGDAQPKIVSIPLIDDSRAEAAETLRIKLSGLQGVAIGDPGTALLTITDNDGEGAANPIFDTSFFVRMQYLDFLSREPEPGEPWSEVLNRCPNVNSDLTCDRILVSQSFFGSPEFRLKGFYAFKFYRVAFDRIPAYEEIIPDMRSVSGATAAEVYGKRAAHPVNFTNRSEFKELYDALDNAAFVNALLGRYQLQRITTTDPANPEGETKVVLTREDLINRLAASGALSLTRAQTLRALVESDEVGAAEYNRAFVAMQYYGYLRRTPEADGYQSWLKVINQDPNNVRLMVNGFMNSDEYRLRFGNPNQ